MYLLWDIIVGVAWTLMNSKSESVRWRRAVASSVFRFSHFCWSSIRSVQIQSTRVIKLWQKIGSLGLLLILRMISRRSCWQCVKHKHRCICSLINLCLPCFEDDLMTFSVKNERFCVFFWLRFFKTEMTQMTWHDLCTKVTWWLIIITMCWCPQ